MAAVLEAAKEAREKMAAEAAAGEKTRAEAEAEAEARDQENSVLLQDIVVTTRRRADSMTSMMGDW